MNNFRFMLPLATLFSLALLAFGPPAAESVQEDVRLAIEGGNAEALSPYMDQQVEIDIHQQKARYPREQAVRVLAEFFGQYPPKRFNYVHQGAASNGLCYAIAQYEYQGGKSTVYLMFKDAQGKLRLTTVNIAEE